MEPNPQLKLKLAVRRQERRLGSATHSGSCGPGDPARRRPRACGASKRAPGSGGSRACEVGLGGVRGGRGQRGTSQAPKPPMREVN